MPTFATLALSALTLATPLLAANHDVTVGPSLEYSPSAITAAKGDTVTFKFDPEKHNIAQGYFAKPCDYKEGGFYSGEAESTDPSGKDVFIITIDSTDPMYFYCSFSGHCQGGMVGVINGPKSGDETLDKYIEAASNADSSVTPPKVLGGIVKPAGAASSAVSSLAASSTAAASSKSSALAASASSESASASSQASASASSASGSVSASQSAASKTSASVASSAASSAAAATSSGAASLKGADAFFGAGAVLAVVAGLV